MKISHLEESVISQPPAGQPGPKFGRSKKFLETEKPEEKVEESGCGTSTSGGIASVASPIGGMQKRTKGKGSIFSGIKTSAKFPNSAPVLEGDISEEQLTAKQRREELFKKSKDRDIGKRPNARDILPKEQYEDEMDEAFINFKPQQQKPKLDYDAVRRMASQGGGMQQKVFKHPEEYRRAKELGMVNEFAPSDDGDSDGSNEEQILKHLAAQWWHGDEDPRAERTLASMGWEVGQDEGYDNGGVFVVRAGDVNGNSFISWPAEDLSEGVAEENLNELSPKTLGSYINKANKDVGTLGYGLGDIKARPGKYNDSSETVKAVKHTFNKRIKGVEKAANRLTKQQGVAEGNIDEDEQLDGMALGELKAIAQDAKKIYDVVKNGTPLEAWMYKKITNSNEALTAVAQQVDNPAIREPNNEEGVVEDTLDEKSVSKAQFRTMAAVAHNPKFAKKVGISPKVGKEFHKADKKQDYKDLPDKVEEESKGLWANIHAKRERIKHGSGERMRKPGSKGAPTADALRKSAK